MACACRKLKSGRIGDAARQPGRVTRCVRFAEPGERSAHPGPISQDSAQMRLAQNDDVVHALATDRSDQPLGKRILPLCVPKT